MNVAKVEAGYVRTGEMSGIWAHDVKFTSIKVMRIKQKLLFLSICVFVSRCTLRCVCVAVYVVYVTMHGDKSVGVYGSLEFYLKLTVSYQI